MYCVAFDTETELIERGNVAPRLACLAIRRADREPQLFGRTAAPDILHTYLTDPDCILIGHNTAFDMGVMGTHEESLCVPIFQAYRAGRVRDTMVREQLILIREGRAIDEKKPALDSLAERYLGRSLDKGADSWRYWYGDLMRQPLDRWPEGARYYPLGDASTTLEVFNAQQRLHTNSPNATWSDTTVSPDEVLQVRAFFALHLMSLWGFRTDAAMVAGIRANLEKECTAAEARLLEWGFYKHTGTKNAPRIGKDMKAIQRRIRERLGARAPLTEGATTCGDCRVPVLDNLCLKHTATNKEVLESIDDAGLQLLARISNQQKKLSTFVPLVERGARFPITPRWNGLVRSGRTSCGEGEGNWQNLERSGEIRACVIPRTGYLFGNADVSQGELCTLAQTLVDWFGRSEMAKAIQAGRDLHIDFAVSTPALLGGKFTYAEAIAAKKHDPCKEESCGHSACDASRLVAAKRQFAKVANFGLPGGLGADTFVDYAWTLARIRTTPEEGKRIKAAYLDRWPEMNAYFDRIARLVEAGDCLVQPGSGRLRGGLTFCAAANSPFQGRLADAMKEAMWQLAWKCYVDEDSALYNSRPILFLHDEFIIESPADRAPEAADALGAVMVSSMQKFCPDIPCAAEPRLMERWYKGAKEVRGPDGRLLPWRPKEKKAA